MFDSQSPDTMDANGRRRPTVVLGIDPGLANTGWGVVERNGPHLRCVAYGCVRTVADEPLAERLAAIHDSIVGVIERYQPDQCAVESVFFGTNAKSAFATGQARGVALLATSGARLTLGEYSPVQIKRSVVGTGTADKRQVQFMVRTLLGLDHDPTPDHAADALAAAICHAHFAATASAAAPRHAKSDRAVGARG
jgi:crossover junction endodeoxyribonuclease RuvC